MPKIRNSTVNINYYLDAGGKVDRIEAEAQRNVSIKLGPEFLYEGKSENIVEIPLATNSEIESLFGEADS